MPEDASRWNARYLQPGFRSFGEPRRFLTDHAELLPDKGLAFEAALGLGENSGFLLDHGLRVIGADVSEVAIRAARARFPALMAFVTDLSQYLLPQSRFDVILNFFYLERTLWPQYRWALRPGGLLILQTLTREMLTIQPEIDPHYLLEPGELLQAFTDWEILDYQEGWETGRGKKPRCTAGIIARTLTNKPARANILPLTGEVAQW